MTVQEAARQASRGENELLWGACWEIAGKLGLHLEFKLDSQPICERAIREMTPEQRRLHGISE